MGKLLSRDLEAVARVVHEAVRAWQAAHGQNTAPSWSRAAQWMRAATISAVEWRLANPGAPPSAQHDQWLEEKRAAGWKFGRQKDAVRKTHPMMVAYSALPEMERRKDALVGAIIDALAGPSRPKA